MNQNRNIGTFKNPSVWLGIAAAILYSSWPLGYLLNPAVAHTAYASQLEAPHQPYNWLFITLDVLSGAALIIVGIIQWFRARNGVTRLGIAGYIVFAALVIIAAVVPFDCDSLTASCTDLAHSPLFIIHGLASVISVSTLFVSVLLIGKLLLEEKAIYKLKTLPLIMVFCWGLIGVLASVKYHHADENLVQYGFISICSLSMVFSVTFIEHIHYVSASKAMPLERRGRQLP